jgi:hypothetical protein
MAMHLAMHRRMLNDVHVRAYTVTHTYPVGMAKFLSLAIRPSVERSPAFSGNELLRCNVVYKFNARVPEQAGLQ